MMRAINASLGIHATFIHCLVCERASNSTSCWFHALSIMEITTVKFSIPVSQHSTLAHSAHTLWPTFYFTKSLPTQKTSAFTSSSSCYMFFLLSIVLSEVPMEPGEEILLLFFSIRTMNKSDYIRMKALSSLIDQFVCKVFVWTREWVRVSVCVYGSANFKWKVSPTLKWIIKNEIPHFTFLILISRP